MKAICWHGTEDLRVDNVPDPQILDPKDIIVLITASGICGSDLHLYGGLMPGMNEGDIIGHEPMGIVVETGRDVKKFKKGDRVVVPFVIACGSCFFCKKTYYSCCDATNPGADEARVAMGHAPAGLFGYSSLLGSYPGGQAEFLRVPRADVGPINFDDESVHDRLIEMTGGRGPDRCIDAVGAEAHGTGSLDAVMEIGRKKLWAWQWTGPMR